MRQMKVGDTNVVVRRANVEEIVDLRHAVLRQGLPRDAAIFDGDHAESALHFAAVAGGRAICCATFHLNAWEGKPAWQLRGMATDPAFRSKGIGKQILSLAEETIRQASQVRMLWCNARTPALEFYKKQGWRVVSEEFFIPTAGPHFRMIKLLTQKSE